MRRFEASPRRATPKGHKTFINCTAPPSPGPTYIARLQRSWHTLGYVHRTCSYRHTRQDNGIKVKIRSRHAIDLATYIKQKPSKTAGQHGSQPSNRP